VTGTGALELARFAELDLTSVALPRAGLAILPPDHYLPLADSLLNAGFTGVIGWRNPVPVSVAAIATFLLHTELVDNSRTPAEAVREVRRWFRNPDPSMLPPLLAGQAQRMDEVREDDWMALVYRGR